MKTFDRSKLRILVVDDTKVNRIILEARLQNAGYEVTCAEDGQRALELLGLEAEKTELPFGGFAAVLLDIMMPCVDGMEVLRRVRAKVSSLELPIIMATAKNESIDVVTALREGANDYVTKPIDLGILEARMETHLALRYYHGELRHAHQSLVNAARAESIGCLAAGVAHEIRNPLAQIQMAAHPLRKIVAGNTSGEAMLGILEEAVTKADKVVSKLMETSVEQKLKLVPTDLNSLVTRTAGVMEGEFAERGVTCEFDLAEDLPAARLSPDAMQQALIQVLLNAIQATDRGGVVTLRTMARTLEASQGDDSRTGNRLRKGDLLEEIEVEDSGVGVAEEKLSSVFDPFFTTKPTGTALGLGLTLVRKTMELQGGFVTVANRKQSPGLRVTLTVAAAKGLRTSV